MNITCQRHNGLRKATKNTGDFMRELNTLAKTVPETLNIHFKKWFHKCNPCVINYTFFGRQETLVQDFSWIIDHVKGLSSDAMKPTPSFKRYHSSRSTESIKLANISDIAGVQEYFDEEYGAFGYNNNDIKAYYNSLHSGNT